MDDLISRSEAIRVASGYCHWTNIPAELAKLPPVNPIPCDDAISRQVVLDGLEKYHDGADLHIDGLTYAYDLVCKLPSVNTDPCTHDKPCTECSQYDKENHYCPHFCHVIRNVFEEVGEEE